MTIQIGVITAPRPRSTLEMSLQSLRRAGFHESVLVCSDNGDHIVMDGVATLLNETRLGNKLNWMRCLSLILEGAGDDDWLMVLEDDIAWQAGAHSDLYRDLRDIQRTNLVREAGCFSLYTPRRVTKKLPHALPRGWHGAGMQVGKGMWGAQALLFTVEQASSLLSCPVFKREHANPHRDKNIDAIIGESVNSRRRSVLYRIPCLVDHVFGEANSSLGYRDDRPDLKTDYFDGPLA